MNNKLPALRDHTSNATLASHLNAMHKSRKAFIESESASKLKRALSKQTRTSSAKEFFVGDKVLYKRPDGDEWHGPANVVGYHVKVVIIRHGGQIKSISPNSLRHENDDLSQNFINVSPDVLIDDNDESSDGATADTSV